MIFASAPLKNGRNDYVFSINASPWGVPGGRLGIPGRRGIGLLTRPPDSSGIVFVASPSVVRSANPARAALEAAGLAALFFAAAFLVYAPALNGAFLWDDDAHVTRPALRSLHGLWSIWFDLGATQQYYPLLHSAFWVEHRLWGGSVLGYHFANVAFHASAAWLLVIVLRRLSFPAPVLAGLLFALHPVCVESVAWISEQKNTLSAVLYLCSALAYLGFDERRSRRAYAFASLLFALALLTKSVTATLPAALLVVFWWRRGHLGLRRDVLPLVPWFAVSVVSGLLTAWVERTLIGAEGGSFSLTILARLLLAARATVFYASKLAWPSGLVFIYPRWSVDTSAAWQYLFLAGVVAVMVLLVGASRRTRGPLAGFLLFEGTLFPVLGFVNVYPFLFSYVADHFQYLASIGLIVPAAWALDRAVRSLPSGAARFVALLLVPVVLGCVSWRQCRLYKDPDTLNRATIEWNPSAWLAHYNLAVSLGGQPGGLNGAIAEYESTLRLNPGHWAAQSNLASAYLAIPGRLPDAIAHYEEALRLRPDFAEAHNNLAVALGRVAGRRSEAIAHFRTALRLRPDYDGAWNNLGALLARDPGSLAEAAAAYRSALRLAPDNPEYHYNLANALAATPGGLGDAIEEYQAALRLRPGYMEAHSNLGAAWARAPGHAADAISEYEAALRIDPSAPQVHANLANALARVPGRVPEALAEYRKALDLDPASARTHKDLGVVLSDISGRLQDATREFEIAVRLDPGLTEARFCLGVEYARAPGRRADAVRELEKALELRPDFEPARRALERLRASVH